MGRFVSWLGGFKDGITALIALFVLVVGFYQYLEFRSDKRIEMSLSLLERRENTIFVNARTTLMRTWFDAEGELNAAFRKTDEYNDALYAQIDKEIFANAHYRTAMLTLSAFYSNASACVLDGLCDAPTLCSSLHGEVDDYLGVNRNYFVYLYTLRQEDAVSLYLHLPEFRERCSEHFRHNMYARTDGSFWCRFARTQNRLLGWGPKNWCSGRNTQYAQTIIDAAE